MRWRQPLAAAFVYAVLAAVFVWHGASLTRELSGQGADPWDSPWFLAWWPYALSHHINPLFTRLIWYPIGVSLPWVTSVPLLGLLAAPLTLLAGPVLVYNLYIVTAPVAAAWFAYLLCHRLTRDFWGALAGGFLFGFSSYEMAQALSALNLAVICCVPALLLVVVKRLDDELSRSQAVALAAGLLLAQFLICIEIFAMVFVFGGITWGLAWRYLPARRAGLARLFMDGLWTGPFVALPLLPVFVAMAGHYALINHPALWPYYFTADLLNIFIPSTLNLSAGLFGVLPGHLHLGLVPQEQDAYLGLPLILLLVLFARKQGGTPRGRFLLACFLGVLLCELGPHLWVYGQYTGIILPWALLMHLPLLGQALAVRFAMFTALASAIITAYWVALPGRRGWRLGLALLACLALLPKPHPWRAPPYAQFFAPGRVQQALGPNPKLLILPFAINGPSSFWQMQNGFGFTEVGGYLGFPPQPAQRFSAVAQLFGNYLNPSFAADFATYAKAAGAQYVVAGPGVKPAMLSAIFSLGWASRAVDDVVIFTVPE